MNEPLSDKQMDAVRARAKATLDLLAVVEAVFGRAQRRHDPTIGAHDVRQQGDRKMIDYFYSVPRCDSTLDGTRCEKDAGHGGDDTAARLVDRLHSAGLRWWDDDGRTYRIGVRP